MFYVAANEKSKFFKGLLWLILAVVHTKTHLLDTFREVMVSLTFLSLEFSLKNLNSGFLNSVYESFLKLIYLVPLHSKLALLMVCALFALSVFELILVDWIGVKGFDLAYIVHQLLLHLLRLEFQSKQVVHEALKFYVHCLLRFLTNILPPLSDQNTILIFDDAWV